MSEQNFASTIAQLAREIFGQPTLAYSSGLVFREIPGFDSILAIKYILAIETAFDITLNEEDVDNMLTMGNLMTILQQKKG